MTGKNIEPDGLKARERLILESARSFVNAIGISRDIGDDHDDFMTFLGQVHRLQGASSDEWTWPSHRPLMDITAHFRDMEEPLRQIKAGRETLIELCIGDGTVPKEVLDFMANSLAEPVAWIDRLFQEAYRREPLAESGDPLEKRVAAIEDGISPES